jgi:hypothetical protein
MELLIGRHRRGLWQIDSELRSSIAKSDHAFVLFSPDKWQMIKKNGGCCRVFLRLAGFALEDGVRSSDTSGWIC